MYEIMQKIRIARELLAVNRITKDEYNQRIEGYIATLREFLQV